MPYLNRFQHLSNTLVSFAKHYQRADYELIIVEDYKNQMSAVEHPNLLSLIEDYEDICDIKLIPYEKNPCYNPAEMFNVGVQAAKHDRIILTNPECYHESNILKGLDKYVKENHNAYIVCSCKSILRQNQIQKVEDLSYTFEMWYVHSKHYDRKLHFCTCIRKNDYLSIGGFDEAYLKGIAYEDADFVNKIKLSDIPIVDADDLVVLHQSHSRHYGSNNYMQLLNINKQYYNTKWNRNE